jgi:hypothetical protein
LSENRPWRRALELLGLIDCCDLHWSDRGSCSFGYCSTQVDNESLQEPKREARVALAELSRLGRFQRLYRRGVMHAQLAGRP